MSTPTRDRQRGNDIGPTGLTVAANIARMRKGLGYTQQDLSTLLSDIGRPIPTASIGRIESGDRRVEVDDVVAIALCLETSPLAILLPHTSDPNDRPEITGSGPAESAYRVWLWGSGIEPLDPSGDAEDIANQYSAFHFYAHPWWFNPQAVPLELTEAQRDSYRRMFEDSRDWPEPKKSGI
jgi:transcriptional regulator with XRE-family HTH domain